jgi:superfamily I DNA/RNA helicase
MLTQNLSLKQIEAVNAIDDDVEIIACAGAGKTGVVTRRIINILKCKDDVIPNNIVAFTFTKKAAEELKSRVYSMGKDVLGDTKGFVCYCFSYFFYFNRIFCADFICFRHFYHLFYYTIFCL